MQVLPARLVLLCAAFGLRAGAAEPGAFAEIQPLLRQYCYECHGNNSETREADLNLEFYATGDSLLAAPDVLDAMLYAVEEEEMPPKRAKQLPAAERKRLLAWLKQSVETLAAAAKDDPGLVVAPRLNHLEYDLVIRDLTGRDITAARFFPRDSGGGEGFPNVGEDLTVETGLLENWLEAARHVTAHARILPGEPLLWADHAQPAMSERQAAFFAIRSRWHEWHAREAGRQGDTHKNQFKKKVKNETGKEEEIQEWIAAYLETAWQFHHRAALGQPGASLDDLANARSPRLLPSVLERFYELVRRPPEELAGAGWTNHAELARRWQELPPPDAAETNAVRALCLRINHDIYIGPRENPLRKLERPLRSTSSSGLGGRIWTAFTPYPGLNMDLLASRQEQESSGEAEAGDLEYHPFYLLAPDFRRNAPPEARAELDRLAALVQRIEKPDLTADRRQAAEILAPFLERAWRTPATPELLDPLMAVYGHSRESGLSLASAIQQCLTAVLVSPRFLYRFQESGNSTEPRPIAPRELATRLSFALWGTLPDTNLMAAADNGLLETEEGLQRETARLVADPRARALGRHFAAQWLHFADFAERAQPDPERYKDFSIELAADMEEEATRFFVNLFQADRPLTWIVNADSAEMSLRLAGFYGLAETSKMRPNDPKLGGWRRFELPDNRRGVATMGAVLIGKSQPLRTSPVKRGAWVVIDLLGTPMPDPPPGVPQISEDEVSANGLTVAQQMERHRADPTCMSCHVKLDPMGLALENFGPDGRWRDTDTQGNPLVTQATAPDGSEIAGLAGLMKFLLADEQMDMIARQFSRKLLGYLLGRKVHLGDRGLIDQMTAAMRDNEWRVMPALQTAVASRQFRFRRDEPATPQSATLSSAPSTLPQAIPRKSP